MLQPKRTKFRKEQKGKMKGNAQRGNQIAFGSFGIKAMEMCLLTGSPCSCYKKDAKTRTDLDPNFSG